MNAVDQAKIQSIIDSMTLEEKVGQCIVMGFVGTVMTPKILKRIRTIHPAGVRCATTLRMKDASSDPTAYGQDHLDRVIRTPHEGVKDFTQGLSAPYISNAEFCHIMNRMKKAALSSGAGIPLHITLDKEGDSSSCYQMGGVHYYPSAMGVTKSGDTQLAYDVGYATAKEVASVGFSWIHSPDLDLNTNPKNPEICTRSFGESKEEALPFQIATFRGLRDGGLITTGKHFPGRGPSITDSHKRMPIIDIPIEELQEHLDAFQALIDEGIPSIMTAHTAYPALDPSGLPATLSKAILTDLLRGKMHFEGVITTDDITMGGIVERYEVHEACIMAINAGADLVLFRDESSLIDEAFPKIVKAAQDGVIPTARLDDAVRRTLSVKMAYGLFETQGLCPEEEAGKVFDDPAICRIAKESARKTTFVLRDRDGLLPLSRDKRTLLIEQIHPLHLRTNTVKCHPSLLWEKMLFHDENLGSVECSIEFTEDDRARVMRRVDQADILVITNQYHRGIPSGNGFIKELMALGKPIVVISNNPYEFSVQEEYGTVVMCYGGSPESMEALSDVLYGEEISYEESDF